MGTRGRRTGDRRRLRRSAVARGLASRRLGEKSRAKRPRSSSGRWTLLVHELETVDVEAFAKRLLARYGVVFRDLIARERIAPPWRDLLGVFRRMEAQGELRGGRFVAGFIGEQFALAEAIDALRAVRRSGAPYEPLSFATIDPLHLHGTILPREPGAAAAALLEAAAGGA